MRQQFRPILAAVQTSSLEREGRAPHAEGTAPFVTISRQAGAGGATVARRLAERLNSVDPGSRPWQTFDRELVEMVAAQHQIRPSVLESLEQRSRTWLTGLIDGLNFARDEPGELALFHRVSETILALARSGRVILVGRGGAFVTQALAGGVHVYLVAPFKARVQHMAKILNCSADEAARTVQELDENRQAFYQRHFPDQAHAPERFTIVLNTARLSEEQVLGTLVPLCQGK